MAGMVLPPLAVTSSSSAKADSYGNMWNIASGDFKVNTSSAGDYTDYLLIAVAVGVAWIALK